MSDDWRAKAIALELCTFAPGTNIGRFVRNMHGLAQQPNASLTPRQAAYLDTLCWRFRTQLSTKVDPETWQRWVDEGQAAGGSDGRI